MIVSLTNCMTAMTGGGMMSPSHAALNWSDADPSVFPSGLRAVYKATGWPVVAHARAWASAKEGNVYSKADPAGEMCLICFPAADCSNVLPNDTRL